MSVSSPHAVLHDFKTLRPRFEHPQEDAFTWLPAAHARAELTQGGSDPLEKYRRIFRRVGCSPEQIGNRGHELADFNTLEWADMRVFRLHEKAEGVGAEARTQFYSETVQGVFERFYEGEPKGPSDLIHVTCTGYVSPSPAQRLAASKGWVDTHLGHAYHMGCYAAVPAVRQAVGFVHSGRTRVDIVHTELCTLHLNPADHSLENIVIQTLFADGHAKYSVSASLPPSCSSGLEVLAAKEVLVPGTEDAMTWLSSDFGMRMTLSKDVPALIAGEIEGLVDSLLASVGLSSEQARQEARFAVHPGGPKILDHVQTMLKLRPDQVRASREVLFAYGNMSSATLPHIWEKLLADPCVPSGALIVSLAFGPGLTLCGTVFRKIGAGPQ